MKTAIICGVSGQDGSFLAELLLSKGYRVVGTSRDASVNEFRNLNRLKIREHVETVSMVSNDFRSVLQVLRDTEPDEIYNLAGQSSVGLSFGLPIETYESIAVGTLNLLEAVRFSNIDCRIYNAGSGECFGETHGKPANEKSAFRPLSPYATAKAAAYWTVSNFRNAYGMFTCTGILFNHESPLRPSRFVTKKIVQAACGIARSQQRRLNLGNIDVRRDWGWAPEYVEAMWLMLQAEEPSDYVIATGESNSLRAFCELAFEAVGLDLYDYLDLDDTLLRPLDIKANCGNASKAREDLGWVAKTNFETIVQRLVEAEMNDLSQR